MVDGMHRRANVPEIPGIDDQLDVGVAHRLGQEERCTLYAQARDTPEVVCRMTLSLVSAHLDALGVRTVGTSLDPASDRCCVTLQRV